MHILAACRADTRELHVPKYSPASSVGPMPVRVEHNGTRLLSADSTGASAGTLGPSKLGMGLSSEGTNLLGCNSSCKEDKGQHRLAVEHYEVVEIDSNR